MPGHEHVSGPSRLEPERHDDAETSLADLRRVRPRRSPTSGHVPRSAISPSDSSTMPCRMSQVSTTRLTHAAPNRGCRRHHSAAPTTRLPRTATANSVLRMTASFAARASRPEHNDGQCRTSDPPVLRPEQGRIASSATKRTRVRFTSRGMAVEKGRSRVEWAAQRENVRPDVDERGIVRGYAKPPHLAPRQLEQPQHLVFRGLTLAPSKRIVGRVARSPNSDPLAPRRATKAAAGRIDDGTAVSYRETR